MILLDSADPACGMCTSIIDPKTADETNIICRSERFVVGINPRWSPHLGRVAIAPKRHIGPIGVYGFESLDDGERLELQHLRRSVTDAIIAAFGTFGMSTREGVAHIDAIVRPSPHPSLDLFPAYDHAPVFQNWTFPAYEKVKLNAGSGPELITPAATVLASFSNPALLMPEELRQSITDRVRRHLRY